MSLSKLTTAVTFVASLASFVTKVQAHGYVTGIVAGGTYYQGYIVTQFPYETDPPAVVGWTQDATDLGYVSDYTSDDIICHKNATNAQATAKVAAGDTVELQWSTPWPSSHHGPVINYLASCGDDCTTVDKTTLEFVKFDAGGLVDDTTPPGTWASDDLIANNNSWTVTIPSSIAAGNYVLRHEIIALHSAESANGAQNYPQCFNLEITGGGSDAPDGTLGTSLYSATDPGILINIYTSLSTYDIPGPTIPAAFATGSTGSNGTSATATAPVVASTAATTTAAVPTATSDSSSAASVTSIPTSSLAAASSVTGAAQAVSPTSTVAAASVTTAAPSAIVSAISSLTAALPTSVLASAAPTATATTGSGSTISTSGLSVSELIDLLKQVLLQLFASSSTTASKARSHARDLSK